MDDRSLVKGVNEGDPGAVRLLVKQHENLVWRLIISMTGRHADSEDLFQEVFLRVFKGIKRFKGDARLSTWIGSIAHHVCVDYLRKMHKEVEFRDREQGEISIFAESNNQNYSADINKIVLDEISRLPDAFKTAIVLYHLDHKSYQEIAEITGTPEGTVKSNISRGRKMLRARLMKAVPDLADVIND